MADSRAIAARWPDARQRTIAALTCGIAEAPHALTSADRAGLTDDEVVHLVALAAFFGHLNRVADAVGIALDYDVQLAPPHAEPATPAYLPASLPVPLREGLALASRAPTAQAMVAWRAYLSTPRGVFTEQAIAQVYARVAQLLGDPALPPAPPPSTPFESALLALADETTLAPWRLGDASFAPLRALGLGDADLFRACTLATSAGTWSRISVALSALQS